MARPHRRGPTARLALILAALASLLVGYYLGQAWQRRGLDDLTAVLYPVGRAIEYPAGFALPEADPGAPPAWRLVLVADTRDPACSALLRQFALVINRLATKPDLQGRLRVTVLAYDQPDADAVAAFAQGAPWLEVPAASDQALETLAGQLGLLPDRRNWCTGTQSNSVLVAPDHTAWALLPLRPAAVMAHDIARIVDFVE